MAIWDSATITRFTNAAEDAFVREYPCIIQRTSLDIVSGTSAYTLPTDVLNIRRVTWKGTKLDPIPQRDLRNSLLSGSTSGRPWGYIFNNIARQTIQLYPVPNETIVAVTTNLFGSAISTQCIVEYYSGSDHVSVIIPSYLRRRLFKVFILKMCFAMESKGQNFKASMFYDDKWKTLKEMYGQLLDELMNHPRRLIAGGSNYRSYREVPRPVLGPEFGISVGDES